MLAGDDLDPYRSPQPPGCWWCGDVGNTTREHKFKASDLRAIGVATSWSEAGYMAKQMGCLLVDSGFSPPQTLRDFLDQRVERPADMSVWLALHLGVRSLVDAVEVDGGDPRGLFLLPGYGEVSRTTRTLTRYFGGYFFGPIGLVYEWTQGGGHMPCFFDAESCIPVLVGAPPQ